MLCNSFHILFDNGFYHFYFRWFKAMIIYKFYREQIKLGLRIPFYHMYINGRMVIGIEQKPITEKHKYCWHSRLICPQK